MCKQPIQQRTRPTRTPENKIDRKRQQRPDLGGGRGARQTDIKQKRRSKEPTKGYTETERTIKRKRERERETERERERKNKKNTITKETES